MSSLVIKAAYLELLPAFERASGCKVVTEWRGMPDIRQRVKAGEAADLVIGSVELLEELAQAGKLDGASRVALVKSGIAAAVRSGAPRPDISSLEAFKRTLRAAKSIIYSSGPSGVYLAGLLERLGIAAELKPKMTQGAFGVFVGEQVASGAFELCFQQVPELMQVAGIDIVGTLPPEIQTITTFSGGVHAGAAEPAAARALLAFLRSPQAAPVIRKWGMEPA